MQPGPLIGISRGMWIWHPPSLFFSLNLLSPVEVAAACTDGYGVVNPSWGEAWNGYTLEIRDGFDGSSRWRKKKRHWARDEEHQGWASGCWDGRGVRLSLLKMVLEWEGGRSACWGFWAGMVPGLHPDSRFKRVVWNDLIRAHIPTSVPSWCPGKGEAE